MHLLGGFLTFLRGTEGELLEAELQMEDLPWNMDVSQGISWGLISWLNLIA